MSATDRPTDDGESRSSRSNDAADAQVSALQDEVDALRRSSPSRRGTCARSRSGSPTCRPTSRRSPRRTSAWSRTLKEARDQIVALKEEVDRLAQPPAGFGVFLAAQRGRHRRHLHRRPQAARRRQPRRRGRRPAPRPGGHAQRGDERRRGAGVRERRRGRHAQGGARRRRARPGRRPHRRGEGRPPRRAAASTAATCGWATRCCSSRAPATSTSGSPSPRSRSSSSKRSPTSTTRRSAAWPRRSSRSATPSSCPTCTPTCSPSTSCARPRACCSTARPAAARR